MLFKLPKPCFLICSCLSAFSAFMALPNFIFADEEDDFQNPVAGVYFGAMGGLNKFNITQGDQTRLINGQAYEFNTSKEDFTGNIHIGNLWGLNNAFSVGVELGATYWGSYNFNGVGSTGDSASYDQETANILMDLQWNITPRIFIMPQVGIAFNIGNASGDLSAGGNTANANTKHKADPLVGLNLGFNVTPALSIYLSGEELMGDSFEQSYVGLDQRLLKSTAVFIGMNYNIGQ